MGFPCIYTMYNRTTMFKKPFVLFNIFKFILSNCTIYLMLSPTVIKFLNG